MVWEVNYWAWLEGTKGWSPSWFFADHNDSIFHIPVEFYVKCFNEDSTKIVYPYPELYEEENLMLPSSSSYIFYKGKHILNTRFVNYSFSPEGRYLIRDSGKILHTKNVRSYLDVSLSPWCYGRMFDDTIQLESNDRFSHGLEDMRLFEYDGKLCFIASNVNYAPKDKIRMVIGEYNPETLSYSNCLVLEPPTDTYCEKNWIPITPSNGQISSVENPLEQYNNLCFIYSWYPFTIGRLDNNGKLNIVRSTKIYAPHFHKVRGSSIFLTDGDNGRIGVVHFSEEGSPRKYYHMLVRLDPQTLLPIAYSEPFCFQHHGVEFCIGFAIYGTQYAFWVSKKDNDATMILIDQNKITLSEI